MGAAQLKSLLAAAIDDYMHSEQTAQGTQASVMCIASPECETICGSISGYIKWFCGINSFQLNRPERYLRCYLLTSVYKTTFHYYRKSITRMRDKLNYLKIKQAVSLMVLRAASHTHTQSNSYLHFVQTFNNTCRLLATQRMSIKFD